MIHIGSGLGDGPLASVSTIAVGLVSYRYSAQVGPVPPNIANNRHHNPWIIMHAGAAAEALLLEPMQFCSRCGDAGR